MLQRRWYSSYSSTNKPGCQWDYLSECKAAYGDNVHSVGPTTDLVFIENIKDVVGTVIPFVIKYQYTCIMECPALSLTLPKTVVYSPTDRLAPATATYGCTVPFTPVPQPGPRTCNVAGTWSREPAYNCVTYTITKLQVLSGTSVLSEATGTGDVSLLNADTLKIVGAFPTFPTYLVHFGPAHTPTLYPCNVVSKSSTEITCSFSEGLGFQMKVQVQYASAITSTMTVITSTMTVSFPDPVYLESASGGSTKVNSGALPTSGNFKLSSNAGGDVIEFTGEHFGSSAYLDERRAALFNPNFPETEFECVIQATSTSTKTVCQTTAGFGADLVMKICVKAVGDPQTSERCAQSATDLFDYLTAPIVEKAQGCTPSGNLATNCPTKGGVPLTIIGTTFKLNGGTPSVTVGQRLCPLIHPGNCTNGDSPGATTCGWNNTVIVCTLPEGIGKEVALSVSAGGEQSTTNLVSYAPPRDYRC